MLSGLLRGRVLPLRLVHPALFSYKVVLVLLLLHLLAKILLVLSVQASLVLLGDRVVMLHGHQVVNHKVVCLHIVVLDTLHLLLQTVQRLVLHSKLGGTWHHLQVLQFEVFARRQV